MSHKRIIPACIALLIVAICGYLYLTKSTSPVFYKNSGFIFGTQYHITYEYTQDLDSQIIGHLNQVDNSLSAFNTRSTLSLVNKNENITLDQMTEDVLQLALSVSKLTEGAFDITIAPLVNAYGFGFENAGHITPGQIDSLKSIVGYKNITINNHHLIKTSPNIILDCGGIAKGYACDVIAKYLDNLNINNYLVEIGGEIRAKGKNKSNETWKIGISNPQEDSTNTVPQNSVAVIKISDTGIATSGNYRNFYYREGKKYAHIIDPRTGAPSESTILSATVIAPTCAEADAYATAFMVLGLEKSKEILSRQQHLIVYFIYTGDDGQYQIWTNNKTDNS